MREMAACGFFLLRQDYQGRGSELVWPAAEDGGEILGGAQLRSGRLFSCESGRLLVIAFDHGTTLRVPLETGRPLEVVGKIRSAPPATGYGAGGSRAVREPKEIGEAARSIRSYDPYFA